jgi:hypothetical protein
MAPVDTHEQESHKPLHAGDSEAAMWGIEKDFLLRQTMTAVPILDQPPDREVLLDHLERASRTPPSFRRRLVEVPLRLSTPRWIGAPGDGSIDGVFEFARQSTMSGLDRDRPLWTVTVVEGLQRGEAAVIIKMDHNEAMYLAGGKVVGLYPFGPLVGAAANRTFVGYIHKAFVGINVDAAAVPDLDMLAGCIREGFDAVIALGDVS